MVVNDIYLKGLIFADLTFAILLKIAKIKVVAKIHSAKLHIFKNIYCMNLKK